MKLKELFKKLMSILDWDSNEIYGEDSLDITDELVTIETH